MHVLLYPNENGSMLNSETVVIIARGRYFRVVDMCFNTTSLQPTENDTLQCINFVMLLIVFFNLISINSVYHACRARVTTAPYLGYN